MKGTESAQASCWEERNILVFPLQRFADLPSRQINDLLYMCPLRLKFDCLLPPCPCVVESCIHCTLCGLCHLFDMKQKVLIKAANFCFMNECNQMKNILLNRLPIISLCWVTKRQSLRFTSTKVNLYFLQGF